MSVDLFDYVPVHYDDLHFREVAEAVIEHISHMDDETLHLVISCEAQCAEVELSRN